MKLLIVQLSHSPVTSRNGTARKKSHATICSSSGRERVLELL
jgi:hypothetical protein